MQENLTILTGQVQEFPQKRSSRKDDLLWKGIIENVFEDFLRFMHPDAEQIFDLSKGIEFLDKELEQVFPLGEDGCSTKVVDKLVKLYTIDGVEEWILLHIEVQGKYQKNFAERMYTYNYRIWDKHHKPITAYAIFTESFKVERSNRYERNFLGTRLLYKFNTYKISKQDDDLLLNSNNPFALVVLIAKAAFKLSKISNKRERDRVLLGIKQSILEALHKKGFRPDKIRHVMNFLRYYVRFETEEFNNIFEQEVEQTTGRTETMGIEELLLDRATKQGIAQGIKKGIKQGIEKGIAQGIKKGIKQGIEKGIEQGIEKGIEKGRHEEAIEIARELKKEGLNFNFIAKTTRLSIKTVEKL